MAERRKKGERKAKEGRRKGAHPLPLGMALPQGTCLSRPPLRLRFASELRVAGFFALLQGLGCRMTRLLCLSDYARAVEVSGLEAGTGAARPARLRGALNPGRRPAQRPTYVRAV